MSLAAVVMLSASAAWGQTPYVENHFVPNPAQWIVTGPFDYTAIPGSDRELTLPAGTVLISWSCTMLPDQATWIRPTIGGDAPAEGAVVRGSRSTGSWLTTTTGGTVTVGLQVRTHPDYTSEVGQIENGDSISWSIMVVPDAVQAGVPAVSSIGLVLMVGSLMAGGGYVLRKRSPASA